MSLKDRALGFAGSLLLTVLLLVGIDVLVSLSRFFDRMGMGLASYVSRLLLVTMLQPGVDAWLRVRRMRKIVGES